MDFALSEEQEMLRKMSRDFLENECPKSLVREMEEDEQGYSPDLWKKMAELGWMGLVLPAEHGGEGMAFLDLAVLIEELGRALVPGPYLSTVVYCGLPILAAGTEEQKKEYLPRIAKGELIGTLALTEPSASWDPQGVETRAEADGDDFVISGTKLFISDAHVSDLLLCVARTKDSANPEDGITLFLVDAKSPGITMTALKTIGSDKQFEVVLDKVRVPKKNILGQQDKGWDVVKELLPKAILAQCALMVGGAQQVLEMTVNYAKERVQFGKPIGSFQAIQHKCADMATDVDGCRFITYQAAWKLSEGLPCALEVSMAKAWVSEAYRWTCAEGHQIHGGIGFIKDHDMQLYYRRAKTSELMFGDADYHRELVAQQIGL
jgi:alkylation response protein AidB-like acyl-CoA dehydrogenase